MASVKAPERRTDGRRGTPAGGSSDHSISSRKVLAWRNAMSLGTRPLRSGGVLLPLAALWVYLSVASPVFLTGANIQNLLLQASIVGILALGTTLVIITEEIDLSIGAVEGFAAVIAAIVAVNLGLAWPLAVVLAIGAGFLIGLLNGLVTTLAGVPSFIATLGMLGIAQGAALVLTDGQSISGFPSGFQFLGQGYILGVRAPIVVAIVVLVALHFLLRYSRVGLNLYSVGGNRKAAELVGISATRTKTLALAISGACAGIAGVLAAARLNSANGTFGQDHLLDAIAAVVIGGAALTGGVGSVIGTAFGVLMIVTIRNGLNLLGVSPFWQTTAVGAMILAAALLDQVSRQRGSH